MEEKWNILNEVNAFLLWTVGLSKQFCPEHQLLGSLELGAEKNGHKLDQEKNTIQLKFVHYY